MQVRLDPSYRLHPTVEHLAPMFVTLGAASDAGAAPTQVIHGFWMGMAKRSCHVD